MTLSKLTGKSLASLCLILLGGAIAFAQNDITVRGDVVDEAGEPMIAAGVVRQGTTQGVMTDVDGKFEITVPEGSILEFSSVSYVTKALQAAPQMHVVLLEDHELLDEVVVIGYGTTKAKNFTGSVDQVKMSDSPVSDLNLSQASDLLRGRLSGVIMGAESGTVGSSTSILVRGRKSVNSTTEEPLIILNGVIFSGELDDIAPSTIESISVLKDATSLAAYGSRAAQGVIMVTTKKGKAGKPRINFTTSHQFSTPTYRQKYLDGQGYITYKNMKNGNVDDLTNTSWMTPFELDNYKAGKTTDWYDLSTQTGYTQNYNANFSGGGDNFNYFIGAGHSGQKGMTRGNEFARNNISVNVSSHIAEWLEVGANFNFTNTKDDSMSANIYNARLTPYGEPYLADGKTYRRFVDGQDETQVSGLWNLNGYADKDVTRTNLNIGGFASVDIPWVKGLNYRINASWSKISNESRYFYHESYYPTLLASDYDGLGYTSEYVKFSEANGSTSLSTDTSWVIDNILTYSRSFGEHYVSGSLVYTRDSSESVSQGYSGKGFADAGNTLLGWYALGNASVQTVDSPTYSLHTDVGYLARLIYSYKDTYHFNASFRRDGSSVFGKDNKWGNFPAIGAAWTISNEKFMDGIDWLNVLKLKLSWGKNGAQTLSPYGTLSTISMAQGGGISSYYDGSIHWGQTITALGNPELGWQTTSSWNGGFEAEAFKGRVSLDVNAYKSKTTDQIFNRNIPIMSSGITTQKATMGQVDNWGIEANLNTVNVRRRDLTWTSNVVFTLNRNKLVDLYGDGQDDVTSSLFLGKSLGAIYGYKVSRIDPDTGTPLYIAADGSETANPSADDRTILGYSLENFRVNFANTLTWKKFQLYVMFTGIFGGGGYGLDDDTFAYLTYNTGHSTSAYDIPFWTPTNRSETYPSPSFTNPGSYYAVYNSYGHVRLQDLSLSYDITPLVNSWGIQNAKVSVSGRNLFYIAPHWKLSDPEARSGYSVSLPKAVTFALNLTF